MSLEQALRMTLTDAEDALSKVADDSRHIAYRLGYAERTLERIAERFRELVVSEEQRR